MPENIRVRFCFLKGGIYYFVRRVPHDLESAIGHSRISFSLRTKSKSVAQRRSLAWAARLDEYWFRLRLDRDGAPFAFSQPLEPIQTVGSNSTQPSATSETTASKALAIYLRIKGTARSKLFQRTSERALAYLVEVCGDRSIASFTRRDANSYRDWLIAKGLTGSSVTRMISCVRSIINVASNEEGVDPPKAFSGVQYDRMAGVRTRQPIPLNALRNIQIACVDADDDRRWLIALIADTGLRLSEAAGLARTDLILNHPDGAFVEVKPHPWRSLKTVSSERRVPFERSSLVPEPYSLI